MIEIPYSLGEDAEEEKFLGGMIAIRSQLFIITFLSLPILHVYIFELLFN